MKSFSFEAIGTTWSIDIYDVISSSELESLQKEISQRIELFDKTYSRFRPDSLVTKMSKEKGTYVLPKDAEPLVSLYKQLYEITNGAFTPLIGNVLSDAGYDATYSLEASTLQHPKKWEEIVHYSSSKLTTTEPVILDFGAAGKGYLVDIIGTLFIKHGIESYCIDASGDMLYKNKNDQPLQVGLEHPEDSAQVIGFANILNNSLCGSAGNRRAWGKFHHIINPHTLTSPKHILAIWVIAEQAIVADALTTALFFTNAKEIEKHFEFKYVIIKEDYTFEKSKDFPGELFIDVIPA
jgi:thiamine biosynthesis lipoprotein